MINKICMFIALMTIIGVASADPGPGAVMAVTDGGDALKLYPGTSIYIKGVNLVPNALFSWEIYDMEDPSCVSIPKIGCAILKNSGTSGSRRTDSDGDIKDPFHSTGWTIPDGDYNGHKYKLRVTIGSNDEPYAEFYTKIDSLEPIPELNSIILVTTGLIGLVLMVKRYKR